ncbi:succinylglutamate desuccinylase/aspartoacylase family protein [Methanobrevibacter sp.]|uniref:succinylglutamate desuccinylase/aspartoacylase domain-containing protein n=1 Tax=Methanobrevibacter sp. TaxID=66852 RepID=UPI00386E114C
MKKRYLVLALIVLICGMSIVSASENISAPADTLGIDEGNALSDNVGDVSDNLDEVTNSSDSSIGNEVNNSVENNDSTVNNNDNNVVVENNTPSSNPPAKPVAVAKAKKVVTSDIKVVYGNQAKYTVKVLDKSGKPIANKPVTITIGKKTLTKNTASNGVATFSLKYSAGNYVIKYAVDKLSGSNTFTVKNKITLTVLKWGIKGDVSKIKLIKNNMPNNAVVKKAVEVTKKGLPLLMFKGGPGKVVFMTAGVHGNELSSQVAAMKMIAHLSKTPIKGTIYIIPFVNVKAISKKVRYTDKDFNRIASQSGTIPNKIVKLVVKYKCDAYGDFHTTKPGGVPGKNIVMGSKGPATKSADLTNYIAKNAKVNKKIYKYAGEVYPGAISDNVNKYGIPAVICEVVLPHNTVTTKSVTLSYNMMKYFLKFSSVI